MAQMVSEIMSTDPATVPGQVSISEAARLMREREIGDVLVTEEGRLRGVLTDRDIVVRAVAEERTDTATVREICTEDVVSCRVSDEVDRAARGQRVEQGLEVAEVVREPEGVRADRAAAAEAAPVGRHDVACRPFLARQLVDEELEGRAHVHPAVRQHERGPLRRGQRRVAPLVDLVAHGAHGQLAGARGAQRHVGGGGVHGGDCRRDRATVPPPGRPSDTIAG